MGRNVTRIDKDGAIEKIVRDFFQRYSLEIFLGRVTTDEVIATVRMSLVAGKMRLTQENIGTTYDFISDLGPVGEGDVQWLVQWGAERRDWALVNQLQVPA